MNKLVIAEALSDSYRIGQYIGASVIPLLLLFGIYKCIRLMWRPGVNNLCLLALCLLLVGLLVSACTSALGVLLPEVKDATAILGGVALLTMSLLAIILAVVGLATYDNALHQRGRAQAVWSLVLGGVFVLIGMSVVFTALKLEDLASDMAAKASESSTVVSEEFNCSMTCPPRWITTKAARLNKEACMGFRRARPEGYAIVIAEHVDGEIAAEDLMEVVKENMAAAATSVTGDITVPISLNGIPFLQRKCTVRLPDIPGVPMYFEQWVTTRPGYAWQLQFWGPERDQDRLGHEFRALVESFRILDTSRVIPQGKEISNVDRRHWGYLTRLPTEEWKTFDAHDIKLADFAAARPNEVVLVLPVQLPLDVPDVEVVATGLLDQLGISHPSEEWASRPWTSPWGEGVEITGTRTANAAAYDYVLRVVKNGKIAHLHAGWATQDKGDLKRVREALDAIVLNQPEGDVPAVTERRKAQFGLLCNDIGIALYGRNLFQDCVPWFQHAFEQTKQDPAILGNVADAMRQCGRAKEALEYLKPHYSLALKSPVVLLHEAGLHVDCGDAKQGAASFHLALEAGLKDEQKALQWLQTLHQKEQYELAVESAAAWMKRFPTINARRWHAQTHAYAGDSEKSLELLEQLAKEFPDDPRVTYDLGEILNDAGAHERAGEIATKLLADGKESPRALMILGWSQMGRKWYQDAKATFEKTAVKLPDDESVQAALRRASAMLGQGSNSDIKTPIAPVPIPEAVLKVIAASPPAKDYGSDQPVVWLLRASGTHFDPEKPLRRTWHRRVRILTSQGARNLSSIEHPFDPLSERIYINHVSVRDENGKVTKGENITDDAYVMDIDDGHGTHRKKLHFQIPGLRPGSVLEYAITTEEKSPTKTFPFQRHLFSDCAAVAAYITGPSLDEVLEAPARIEDLRTIRDKELHAWIGLNLPFDVAEPFSTLYEDRVPGITLSGKEGSWAEVAKAYLKDIDDRLRPDAQAAKLVARLIQDARDDREKIARIAQHVQKEISYTAIEFGIRARRPNSAAHTLEKHYGDCKDQALLLHQLLMAAGITSHLALVNTDWRIQPALPTLDQFNHMVVHVLALGPGWLVDPTNKSLHIAALHADGLWHSHALILDPAAPKLTSPTETATAGSSKVESQRRLRLEGGAWKVTETLTANGYYASWLRAAYTGLDAPQQLRKTQSLMEAQGRLHLNEARFENLDDPAQPARLQLHYDIPDAVQKDADGLRASIPALWERDYLSTTFVKGRRTAFVFRYPFQLSSTVTFEEVPASFAKALQTFRQDAKGVHAEHQFGIDPATTAPALRFEFEIKPGVHPASAYQGWQEEWSAARKAWEQPLRWSP